MIISLYKTLEKKLKRRIRKDWKRHGHGHECGLGCLTRICRDQRANITKIYGLSYGRQLEATNVRLPLSTTIILISISPYYVYHL